MSTQPHSRSDQRSSTGAPPQTPSSRSHYTVASTERDFESEFSHEVEMDGMDIEAAEDPVHFCLLAEFDIDAGATLAHQYPYPTGTDEQ